ncbi:MAG TPA: plastocyanin/azurin family copper-binding protein [Bacteroidota bacterium]|nr:plastocyanin/azurin family copper-binding protein [Bacteroidota bacterium]
MRTLFYIIAALTVSASRGLATVHTISNSGFTFSPNNVTIVSGDTVQFVIAAMHDAVEVSKATWDVNGNTSNGGFMVPFGGGTIVLTDTGTHYYVCEPHASIGMKGIIAVNPAPPPPLNSLTVESTVDQDGNISTTADRMMKNWSLKLYRDSVGSGVVLDSVVSGKSFTAGNLPGGTYVAVEADSASWSHISVDVDGVSQGATAAHQWPVTVFSGENHTISFLNFGAHTIMSSAVFTFVPESLAVVSGDTVHFVLDPMHTAREVSRSTWLANDTVSNGGFDLPHGGGSAILSALGTHYYVCTVHASIGMKGRIVVLAPGAFFTVDRQIAAGWNMVSLPVNAPDRRTTTLFPTAVSHAFSYQGSYVTQSLLSIGLGYWLKFNTGQTASLTGFPVVQDTIDALKGWNMIGSLAVPHSSHAIASLPGGIISSPMFGFNGSYFVADTIVPGYGYWLKVSAQGKLILDTASGSSLPSAASADPARRDLQGKSRLTIRDAMGREKALYFSVRRDGEAGSAGELPPIPPPGAFDVRFSSGHELQFLAASGGRESGIVISSALYPITAAWDVEAVDGTVTLGIDGRGVSLTGRGAIKLTTPPRSLFLRAAGVSPSDYTLNQAFPNPFNSATVVRYDLPVDSRVLIRVYSVLGQLVATLADGIELAGQKSVSWNAADHVSGVYFLRLDARPAAGTGTSFRRVVKAVLQR